MTTLSKTWNFNRVLGSFLKKKNAYLEIAIGDSRGCGSMADLCMYQALSFIFHPMVVVGIKVGSFNSSLH